MPLLAEIFGPGGRLAERLPGYTYRAAQRQMAELVGEAIDDGRHAALEAGTGIGKTYAYLVPVLLSGRRAIISTGTRTLQDQLFNRDLPALGAVLGRPVEIALLKGRSNYLCWHRFETARLDGREAVPADTLETLAEWGRSSASGDLAELDELAAEHTLRGQITSTVDNCLGSRCEFIERCFVVNARRRAMAARVVIVNHHLLLADLALKEAGFGDLLPGADVIVVDEAHQFPDIAQRVFSMSVASRELEALLRDIVREGNAAGLGREANDASASLASALVGLRRDAAGMQGRYAWEAAPGQLVAVLGELRSAVEAAGAALELVESASAGLGRCRERCAEASRRLDVVMAEDPGDGLRWLEVSPRSLAVHWTPLDIGAAMAERLADQAAAWIFTSATLAVGDDFTHFLARVGVDDALTSTLPSPFDHAENGRIYLPRRLPDPADPGHVAALMEDVWPLIDASGGGAFLLFTSYRALNLARDWLERQSAPGPVLVQGAGSRSQQLEEFRAAGNAILLGTNSFWQGVDVRGHALRVVVIAKLPFQAPNDPLIQARIEAVRRNGGDPFREFQLPEAVLALKQGAGRLIRDFDDRGLIVLGDPRLATRPYGRVFLKSLPPMPLLDDRDAALEFAAGLREPADSLNSPVERSTMYAE